MEMEMLLDLLSLAIVSRTVDISDGAVTESRSYPSIDREIISEAVQ